MAKLLDSGTISVFAESIAMMLSAGIQTDEAVHLLSNNMEEGPFKETCAQVYLGLIDGKPLHKAMKETKQFPIYAVEMVRAGEKSGYLENVLNSLATYYNEEDRLFVKMRSAIMYPAALLAIMTVILIFTVTNVLPLFLDVYSNISGELYEGSFAYVKLSLGIGYASLIVMAIGTVLALAGAVMSGGGDSRVKLISFLEKFGPSSDAMYHMALARFTAALSTYISSGTNADRAILEATEMTDHALLRHKAQTVYEEMTAPENPKNLAQAIYDNQLFDPLYARMLLIGSRSGTTESVLRRLSNSFFDDAIVRIDTLIDSVEPTLAGILTVSVGATLISVMMPLVGILGSIG